MKYIPFTGGYWGSVHRGVFSYKWPWVNLLIHLWAAAEVKDLCGLPVRCVAVFPCQCARGMNLFQIPSLKFPVWLPLRMGGLTLRAAITWLCLWILQFVRGSGCCGSCSFNLYVLKSLYPEKWKCPGGCVQGHSALCSNLLSQIHIVQTVDYYSETQCKFSDRVISHSHFSEHSACFSCSVPSPKAQRKRAAFLPNIIIRKRE